MILSRVVVSVAINIFLDLCLNPLTQALPSERPYRISLTAQPPSNASQISVTPFCFTQTSHPGIVTTNAADCNRALGVLVRERHFTTPFKFSKSTSPFFDVIVLPKGWGSGECVIFVSCANREDTDIFSYADVARIARRIVTDCVKDNPVPYGGLEEIGSAGTFYVSVGRPPKSSRPLHLLPFDRTSAANSSTS